VIVTHSELILRRLALDKIILCEEAKQSLFLGTYDEFLEKVGWEEKKPEPKQKVARQPTNDHKVLEKEIQKCEKTLIGLEQEQKDDEKQLESGDHSAELFNTIAERQDAIQELEKNLYDLLERLRNDRNKG
jgi:ATP-binding cassette subfamily F protein 3